MILKFKNFIKNIRYSLFDFNKFFFTNKPLKTKEYYFALHEKEKKTKYPSINNLEKKLGYTLNKEWLEKLALTTQVVIKRSKLNYQHGRVLYSFLRKYIIDNNISDITIMETGTSRGFSSICMSKAIIDSNINGRVVTFDIIPHNKKMFWNIYKDHEDLFTRDEILKPWKEEVNKILFIEGWTNKQLNKTGINRINFAFLDAQHEYENVMQEYKYVEKRQITNDIIIFDDVTENQFDGVVKAVNEIKKLGNYSVELFKSSDNRAYAVARKIKE